MSDRAGTVREAIERGLAGWRFPALLALLLCAVFALSRPQLRGDVVEYTLDTIALAGHGAPDIRLSDVERAMQLAPHFTPTYQLLAADLQARATRVFPAFIRGREGKVYSIHFFGYSLLAAAPFKAFELTGVAPFKAFQAVNLAAVFILGLALRRFFGSGARALLGVGLFMLAGGALFANWSSPECVGAAALLSALLLFASDAPLAAALLAGLAAQQNPTILAFFGFAPLLMLAARYRRRAGLAASLRPLLTRRLAAAWAAGLALFALPLAFNLYHYGVPNIIAARFSDPALVDLTRLASFFLDLNQGMIIALPGVLAALLLWAWQGAAWRRAWIAALCCAFTLVLVLPALAVANWNSDAAGVMRYAFWAAMPLLFALLLRLRESARWPAPLMLGLALVQGAAMLHASTYSYVEFSPLARLVLARAPGLYHPEPEIFAERSGQNDDYVDPDKVYSYAPDGEPVKTLYRADARADARLCGVGGALAPGNRITDSARGWRYIDGQVHCQSAGRLQEFGLAQLVARDGIRLDGGWSVPENSGGVWTDGWRSRLLIQPGAGLLPGALRLSGRYFDGNRRTRVHINGVDLGWHQLDLGEWLALPPGGGMLEIVLEHEAPASPGPADLRALAFFLRGATLRAAAP